MTWQTIKARDVAVGDVYYSFSQKAPRRITRTVFMPAGRPVLRGPLAFAPHDDVALYYWDGPADEMAADHLVRIQPRAGDIGEPVRRIEFEPLPDEAPVQEPAAPKREAVPA